MSPVRIAAIADVHSPRFLNDFAIALRKCEPPDLFLFAGDMVNRGKFDEYIKILDIIDRQLGTGFPIVACSGNEDTFDSQDELHLMTNNRLTFLDEKSVTLNLSGSIISIVGMSGISTDLVNSQSNSVTEIRSTFKDRSLKLSGLLQEVASTSDYVILLMHFSPLLETNPNEFSWWISKSVKNNPPNHIIHGHVHNSSTKEVRIGTTTIWNVALPVRGSVTELLL